jgi:histidinol-phosphatase
MSSTAPADDLAFAHRLADAAERTALSYFGRPTRAETKPDGTPVGEADLAVDRVVLQMINDERPHDAVLSEESGAAGEGARRWIVDPIDGTVAFLDRAPHWGTHLALEEGGQIVVAVVTRPALGLRWWATLGGGAFRGRVEAGAVTSTERLRTSSVEDLRDARVAAWRVDGRVDVGPLGGLRSVGRWTDVAYNDLLAVVDARAEVMVAPGKVWDHAPFVVLLGQAGGSVIDPLGGPRLDMGWVLFTNGHVDGQLRQLLGPQGSRRSAPPSL